MFKQDVEDYYDRIMHQFNPVYYDSRALMAKHWNIQGLLFDNIKIQGLCNLDEIKDKQLLYFSNHVSLADFLIQGYILWNNDLPSPRFIAGENLNHWPFTNLWKKSGAISVDRNLKERNYLRAFQQVVQNCLENNESLLVYPEGGRSYSGELNLNLKTGAFKPVLNSVKTGRKVFGVPIFMSYDNRIEERFLGKVKEHRDIRDKYLEKALQSRKDKDFIKSGLSSICAGIYDHIYFGWDVFSYIIRPFSFNKRDARISFGEPFSLEEFTGERGKQRLSDKIVGDLKQFSK